MLEDTEWYRGGFIMYSLHFYAFIIDSSILLIDFTYLLSKSCYLQIFLIFRNTAHKLEINQKQIYTSLYLLICKSLQIFKSLLFFPFGYIIVPISPIQKKLSKNSAIEAYSQQN